MKRILGIALALVITLVAVAPAAGAMDATAATTATITVNATGVVTIQPDKATVSLGVSSEDKDAKLAQNANNESTQKLLDALKDAGIPDEQIVTENYSLYPNYDYSNEKPSITSYTASNQLSVTVLDINKVGDVINAAVDAGANQSYGIQFGVQDESEQYQEALQLAVQIAKPKAEAIANASGHQLGDILSIVESGSADTYRANVYSGVEYAAMDTAASMPVQSGTLDIRATVTVVFAAQ